MNLSKSYFPYVAMIDQLNINSDNYEADVKHEKEEAEMMETRVKLFKMWKVVEGTDEDLRKTRLEYKEKMKEFEARWNKVNQGKLAVENNKNKFKHFIREKQCKIEEGQERIEREKRAQRMKVRDLKELKRDCQIHQLSRRQLERCSEQRKVFADYLQLVLHSGPGSGSYSDLGQLINRCQALIGTAQTSIVMAGL